ncbi:MAG: enoyl-CoA hydratase/isomerase family protein [Flavobacteriales bacterium]
MNQFVTYKSAERIGYITIDRANKRNAINAQVVRELNWAFEYAENDDSCKVIILQSTGDVFSAGADLEYIQQLQSFSLEENIEDSRNLMTLFKKIYGLKKVVIAMIQGHAIAGGCGLASICDFSIASDEASFGYSEVKIGFIPAIVSVFLIRKIGEGKTKELLLSGKNINAKQAVEYGLINTAITKDKLQNSVMMLAQDLCQNTSDNSLSATKRLINNIQNMTLNQALDLAVQENALARNSEDCKKGISAFLNKEKLHW